MSETDSVRSRTSSHTTGDQTTDVDLAQELGFSQGQYVQEIGYDEDIDFDFRNAVERILGEDLADEDVNDVFDAVLMWWRSDDPDLVDALVDAQTMLGSDGVVWLLTPKPKRAGHIPPADISEAAPVAGMHVTTTISAAADWSGTRLVAKKRS